MSAPLIHIEHCCVRLGRGYALRDATWDLLPGQHWALLGSNGAGKTTLMRLARGELHPAQGHPFGHGAKRVWDFGHGPTTSALDARERVALISSDDQDAWVRSDRGYSGEELVCTGILDTLALWGEPGPEVRARARAQFRRLGAEDLADRNVLEMSRGQARLAHIARALVREPRVLMLDEALEGLDRRMRARILEALAREAARGTQIVLSTHYMEEFPAFLTHAAVLENGAVARSGPARAILGEPDSGAAPVVGPSVPAVEPGAVIIDMRGVTVLRGGRAALDDVDWTVRRGEHWAVLGDNGAGKSTLAALAMAALRPSTGRVSWFGRSEGVNVWELRKRIGLVSPELQAGYRYNISALDLVASGFFSSVGLYDRVSEEQAARARECMALANMAGFEERPVRSLSYGQIRRLVIARALVTRPELLILDEPSAGLDAASRQGFLADLDALAASGATLVVITHRPEEIPACVGKAMILAQGRVTAMGPRDEVLKG
ncbi:ATP-binding cassette domain-containing protein [Desulfocurvus sp. DL9XJH121]